MKKWEYKQEESSLLLSVSQLNKLGQEGWELVQYIQYVSRHHIYVWYFKRPVKRSHML